MSANALSLSGTVAVHSAKIENLETATTRIETKIDRLVMATIGGLGSVALALLLLALRGK